MRIVLCGKNDAAVDALRHCVQEQDEVLVLCNRGDDGQDGWQLSLKAAALALGVAVEQPSKINDEAFVRRLVAFRADVLVSIQYDQILRDNLFRAIGCPCLNIHFSLLPRHRGVAPGPWAILSGDSHAGVTLHHMVEGIDAGDLIAQRTVPIDPGSTARELYDDLTEAATGLFRELHPFSGDVVTQRVEQEESRAVYHKAGDLDFTKRQVDWSRPAVEAQRFIRAFVFPPLQYPETSHDGRTLQITAIDGSVGSATGAEPGTVLDVTPEHIDVAARDGSLRITGLLDREDDRRSATELLASLRSGNRLG